MQKDLFNLKSRGGVTLRPYQEECIQAVNDTFLESQSCLVVMATGLGKTVTASEIMRQRGGRSFWVAHRSELIEQAEATISNLTGVTPQIEMAERKAFEFFSTNGCVVGSVQTLNAIRNGKKRLEKFDPRFFNTLITDEAHHAVAKSWKAVSEHFCVNDNLKHLGMTATPDRSDELALGQLYDKCAFRYDIEDGVNDAWLVPLHVNRLYMDEIDLSLVGTVAGDLNQGQLSQVMERDKAIHGVASALLSETGSMKTLVFTSGVAHAHGLADILNARKFGSACAIDGKTDKAERKTIMERFKNGDIQYLCNVGIATEGFDVPSIECVAIARPTKSRSLYAQMVGRGTRSLSGVVDGLPHAEQRQQSIADSLKPRCVILDFVGNSGKHKLVSAADVLGGKHSKEVISRANKMASESNEAVDTLELLDKAEVLEKAEAKKREEQRIRQATDAKVRYRKMKMNPFDVLDIEPDMSGDLGNVKPLTQGQLDWLEKSGFDTVLMSSKEQRTVLNNLINRKKRNLASPKQVSLLKRFGYTTKEMKFDEASRLITRLKENNWKRN